MATFARILLDSLSPSGHRLTTFHLHYPRSIHSEFMTHRMFSRNAGSNRAKPIAKVIEETKFDAYIPEWTKNQKGMQGIEHVFSPSELATIGSYWVDALENACKSAEILSKLGVHKQDVNRLLEPWQYIDVVCSATDYDNFFNQRCTPEAHPAIRELANAMETEMQTSIPFQREYHLPYVYGDDIELSIEDGQKLSVARCARVSYTPFDESTANRDADFELYNKLLTSSHWSPFEHQARASHYNEKSGNFTGWYQLRQEVEIRNPQLKLL